MSTVAVIDYGMGNIRSVSKALEYVGGDTSVIITYDPDQILKADRVVFPGVGALGDCMEEIKRLGLDEVIKECTRTKPFFGICLGMQALLDNSEENDGTSGLGIIPGKVKHFDVRLGRKELKEKLKIPHMGWNRVDQTSPHALWEGVPDLSRFYFVHSYYVEPRHSQVVSGTTKYGFAFTSAIASENIFATQFHPEKSQHAGLTLFANFLRWDGTG
ncbi:MAG: imidazole glycerol phosphate synthase subunit HisH [Gammaproteobacteria bacterium]